MLFYSQTNPTAVQTADSGKIRLGGACRLPLTTATDQGRPGDMARTPASTADSGKIRLGGACRLPLTTA